jgi:hypothetical protein
MSSTQELVRVIDRQRKSRSRAGIFLVLVVVAAGAGGYYLIENGMLFATSTQPTVETAHPDATFLLPANPTEMREALKKAPKPIASLMKGSRPMPPSPTPVPGPPGGLRAQKLDAYELARSIANDKRGAVQLCYEHELKRNPRLKGRVTVDLQLKAPHEVGLVRVVDNLKSARFTKCVQTSMRNIDFPALREGLNFEIPFALTAPDL